MLKTSESEHFAVAMSSKPVAQGKGIQGGSLCVCVCVCMYVCGYVLQTGCERQRHSRWELVNVCICTYVRVCVCVWLCLPNMWRKARAFKV